MKRKSGYRLHRPERLHREYLFPRRPKTVEEELIEEMMRGTTRFLDNEILGAFGVSQTYSIAKPFTKEAFEEARAKVNLKPVPTWRVFESTYIPRDSAFVISDVCKYCGNKLPFAEPCSANPKGIHEPQSGVIKGLKPAEDDHAT